MISSLKYNIDISPNSKVTFGFTGSYSKNFEFPKKFTFNADELNQEESEEVKEEEKEENSTQTDLDYKKMMEELQPVDYTILTNGEEGLSLTANSAKLDGFFYSKYDMLLKGKQLDIQGLCASSGNVKIECNNQMVWGKQENANEIVFPDWLQEYKKEASGYKKFPNPVILQNDIVSLDENSSYEDSLNIEAPSIVLNSKIIAKKDIVIHSSNIKTKEEHTAVIVSESGNIDINMSRFHYQGVLYAPNGTITLRGSELNFDGKIIAKNVVIEVDSVQIESYISLDELGMNYPVSEKEIEEMRKMFDLKEEDEIETKEFEVSYTIQDKTRENKEAPYVISIGTNQKQIAVSLRNLWRAKIEKAVIETTVYDHKDKKIFSKKATLKNIRKFQRKTKTYNLTQKSVVETIKLHITIWDSEHLYAVGERNVSAKRYAIEGGAYKNLKAMGGERHHCPAAQVIGVYPYKIKHGDGASFRMIKNDHQNSGSWGSRTTSKKYRKKQKKYLQKGEYKKALKMDIEDIQDKYGKLYDQGLYDVWLYSSAKGYFSPKYKLMVVMKGKLGK